MKKYFIILNILLIAAVIYFGVKASYQMLTTQIDEKNISSPKIQGVVTSENETIHPQSHYTAITDRNLFKTKEKEDPAPPPEPVKVEEPVKLTELKLKLWGTVSGNDRNKAYAVIEDTKERKQNLYREGDTIPVDKAKVMVKEILRQRIILTVNDQDEALEMGENQGEEPKRPEHPLASVVEQPVPPSSSNSNIRLERSKIEESMNNVNNLMRQAKIRPHFKDGKPDGLTLSRIQENSVFSELGLESGDIIVGVDGKKIESVDDALKFYQSLKSSSSVNLEIKRRGETKSIDYTIEN